MSSSTDSASPAAAASSAAGAATLTPVKPNATTRAARDAGVLVIDADGSFRLGLKTFLKNFVGFSNVHTAANGLEALECLRENPSIEVVTLDHDMPEMGGLDFLERVRDGFFSPLAAVMITGGSRDEFEKRFRAFDSSSLVAQDFLEKPVDFNDLDAIILRAHETLKDRQKDEQADTPETPADKDKRKDTTVVPTLAAASKGEGDGDGGKSDAKDDEERSPAPMFGGGLGQVPPESAGGGEVRARIDWLADTLKGRLDEIETRIDNVSARTPSMAERFWLGLLKWIALGLLAWGFVRFNVGDRLIQWYEIAKVQLSAITSAGPAEPMDFKVPTDDEKPAGGEGEAEASPKPEPEAAPEPSPLPPEAAGPEMRPDAEDVASPVNEPEPVPEPVAPPSAESKPSPKPPADPGDKSKAKAKQQSAESEKAAGDAAADDRERPAAARDKAKSRRQREASETPESAPKPEREPETDAKPASKPKQAPEGKAEPKPDPNPERQQPVIG